MKQILLTTIFVIELSSCSNRVATHHECDIDPGLRCYSMGQIAKIVDADKLEEAKYFCKKGIAPAKDYAKNLKRKIVIKFNKRLAKVEQQEPEETMTIDYGE